jgi:hypothetical protein
MPSSDLIRSGSARTESLPAPSSWSSRKVVAKLESRVFENLALARAGHITRAAQLEVDRQLSAQVIDSVGDLTERALRRHADVAETSRLRPPRDGIEAEERHILELTALAVFRDVLGAAGSVMVNRAFGSGGDSCCRS